MIALLLLACTAPSAEHDPPDAGLAPPPEAEQQAPRFEPIPADVRLVPSVRAAARVLDEEGMAAVVAELARDRTWRTRVVVARIAAARTGAELGDLFMEASRQDAPTLLGRLERIRAGVASIDPEGPLIADVERLMALLQSGGLGEPFLAELEALAPTLPEKLHAHLEDRLLPLALACGWLEATWLYTAGMQRTGRYEQGLRALADPRARSYFLAFLDTVGPTEIPPPTVRAAREALQQVHTDRNLTPQEVTHLHDTLDGLLGML